MKNRALVVIDLQNDITKNYREIIDQVNRAIDWAAKSDMHVVYIQNNNLSAGTRTFKPGTHGAELVREDEKQRADKRSVRGVHRAKRRERILPCRRGRDRLREIHQL